MKENLPVDKLKEIINKTKKSYDTANPSIPFIEGDGIGIDIWSPSQKVFDAAVSKAYSNQRKIEWIEVLAGQKAFDSTGEWLPESTIQSIDDHKVGNGQSGLLTLELQKKYYEVVRGNFKEYYNWLTFIEKQFAN